MEPDVLFHTCLYHWFRKLARLAGMDIFDANFKPHARTYLLISALYLLLVSCLWTIYTYPFDEKLISLTFLCFNGQGIVKFHSLLLTTKEMKDMVDFSIKIYRANKESSPNRKRLEKSVNFTVITFKVGMTLLIATAVLTCVKPCISYVLTGKVEPVLEAHFPGIDEQKIVGYACLAIFHTYIMIVFVIGTGASDLGLMTLVIHSYTMSHIFRNAITEFNSLVVKNKENTNTRHIHASLKNLILMHIDFIKYTKTMKLMYNFMCLIQITMANAIMVVLIYIILMMDYFPAYFFMATAFFQVFEYSALGTIVEFANGIVYDAVCNISVIYLPITEQKKVIMMTLIAQNPHTLTIGGFQPLNVETFIYSLKTTYSVGMLLINTQLQ